MTEQKPEKTIVIVGVGAAGASVLKQLVESFIAEDITDYRIVLVERQQEVGRGLAYTTDFDDCILNMTYRLMALSPSNPNGVVDWFKANEPKWRTRYPDYDPDSDPYPPRSLYGMYLEDSVEQSIDLGKQHGIKIGVLTGEVVTLDEKHFPSGDLGVEITLEDGRILHACQVVLSTGNFPPTTFTHLRGKPGYFASFWPEHEVFDIIPKDASIGVIGSSLTAVDICVTLLSNGFTGKVHLTSRNGLISKVKTDAQIVPKYEEILWAKVREHEKDGEIRLVHLAQILREQIETAIGRKLELQELAKPDGTPAQILRADIEAAKDGTAEAWQTVLGSTTNHAEDWWNMLPAEDKETFMADYASLWYVYRNAMPIKNAQRLLKHLESGTVEILPGLKSIDYDDENEEFCLNYADNVLNLDYVINATDIGGMVLEKIDSPFIKNLYDKGVIRQDPFGGVGVDVQTLKLKNDTALDKQPIYFVGYLTRGVHFHTNDIIRIVVHSGRVVDGIMDYVRKR